MEVQEGISKLLIAYDGSEAADEAINGLRRAGIRNADVLVVSVAEHWFPTLRDEEVAVDGSRHQRFGFGAGQKRFATGLDEASTLAAHAAGKISDMFPEWRVGTKVLEGSPAVEILRQAEELKPDLITTGSHGRSAVGRLLLGSISQKILTEARVSVRIGRESDATPGKTIIVIGFDGSPGSDLAVAKVASRRWVEPCEIHLVTASEAIVPTTIGRFFPPVVDWVDEEVKLEREMIRKLAKKAFETLEGAGYNVCLAVRNGNPKQVIVEEAEKTGADCIFVGANANAGGIGRFLIGSTSAAVAARAHCSVEVVRGHLE